MTEKKAFSVEDFMGKTSEPEETKPAPNFIPQDRGVDYGQMIRDAGGPEKFMDTLPTNEEGLIGIPIELLRQTAEIVTSECILLLLLTEVKEEEMQELLELTGVFADFFVGKHDDVEKMCNAVVQASTKLNKLKETYPLPKGAR